MSLEQQCDPAELSKRLSGLPSETVDRLAASNRAYIESAMCLPELPRFDRLAPYFKQEIASLSPLMQKVLVAFVRKPGPMGAQDIASIAFMPVAVASPLLKRLQQSGHLRSISTEGHKHTYEVADRNLLLYMVMRLSSDFGRCMRIGEVNKESQTILSDYLALKYGI